MNTKKLMTSVCMALVLCAGFAPVAQARHTMNDPGANVLDAGILGQDIAAVVTQMMDVAEFVKRNVSMGELGAIISQINFDDILGMATSAGVMAGMGALGIPVDPAMAQVMGNAVGGAVSGGAGALIQGDFEGALSGALGGALDGGVSGAIGGVGGLGGMLGSSGVGGALGSALGGVDVAGAVTGALGGGGLSGALSGGNVAGALGGALGGMDIAGTVGGALGGGNIAGAVGGALGSAVSGGTNSLLKGDLSGAMSGAMSGAVGNASGVVAGALGGSNLGAAATNAVAGGAANLLKGDTKGAVDSVLGSVDIAGAARSVVGDAGSNLLGQAGNLANGQLDGLLGQVGGLANGQLDGLLGQAKGLLGGAAGSALDAAAQQATKVVGNISIPKELQDMNFETAMDSAQAMSKLVADELLPPVDSDTKPLTDTEKKERAKKRKALLNAAVSDAYALAVATQKEGTESKETTVDPAKKAVSSAETIQAKTAAAGDVGLARLSQLVKSNEISAMTLRLMAAEAIANMPENYDS